MSIYRYRIDFPKVPRQVFVQNFDTMKLEIKTMIIDEIENVYRGGFTHRLFDAALLKLIDAETLEDVMSAVEGIITITEIDP